MTPTMVEPTMERKVGERVIRIVRDDITAMEVDAFVFDITEDAKLGSGHGSAIQQRGGVKIQEALDAAGSCPVGEALITTGGLLKAKHIIHANGPKFCEPDEEGKLRTGHRVGSFGSPKEKGVKTLALPRRSEPGSIRFPWICAPRVMVADAISKHRRPDGSLGRGGASSPIPDYP